MITDDVRNCFPQLICILRIKIEKVKSKVKETNSFKFLACLDPQKHKLKVTIFTIPVFFKLIIFLTV